MPGRRRAGSGGPAARRRRAYRTSIVAVVLAAVLLTAGTAVGVDAQTPYWVRQFTQAFRLITEEALAPPSYPVLLQAAVSGVRGALRASGATGQIPDLTITGNENQDLRATLDRLERAMSLARGATTEIVHAALRAMLEAVGEPNTHFMPPADFTRFNEQGTGSFVGLGIQLAQQDDRVLIVGVIEESPAAASGIKPNDVIVSIDGRSTQGLSLEEVRRLLTGDEGSTVVLGLFRPSLGQTVTASVTRARIVTRLVSERIIAPGVGYLRITQFRSGIADQVGRALAQLRDDGARGLVIDLRGNPGGLLTESIDVASHFLEDGVVLTDQRSRGRSTTYLVRPRQPKFSQNLIVLVNRGSASASEIVAGALQDAGVRLVGERTYGKATIQLIYPFEDDSAVRVTVGRYLTRGGRDINNQGLLPDLPVSGAGVVIGTPEDEQLQRAVASVSEMIRPLAMGSP